MRTRLVRRPGDSGTKELVAEYGERLICVRYRYDAKTKQRHKTIELIIESSAWEPPITPESIVAIRIGRKDHALQEIVRNAGGTWNNQQQTWELRYDQVIALGLSERLINLEFDPE
ncbi:hypothetical protein [Candidatus Oscillochloris fontis]|uniref:hypothetical protein n=1 Tax=Candidatus Oscillochloris fontis TaxID=2496868 RepID=UPI00101DF0F1|nr:hypothetical protein [Candidatus Oscillochloris fontis]